MLQSFLAPASKRPVEPGPPPTFSVIVAAYQVADLIGDALDSVRQQTVAPLEVIVCDDGSTDDLQETLRPYGDEIVLIRKQHAGEASAKNAAARAASGDFVVILDADDVYLPRRLEALTALARARPDLDVLTTDAHLVVHGRRVRRNYGPRWRFEVVDQRRAILERNFIFGHAAVRRKRLLEHGGFDEAILWTTDWDLWLRLILDGSLAGMVDEPLALYRLRQTSLTARRRELALGKIATLEKAERNAALRPEERPVVAGALAGYRRELGLIDLRNALLAGDPGVRRAAVELVAARGFSGKSRLEAGAIAFAPKPFAALLRRRARRSWVGAGGIRVTRDRERPLARRLPKWAGARRR
jgi:glycosyltransferase involved in cell wall biosynthesis